MQSQVSVAEKKDLKGEVNQERLQSQDQRTQWRVVSEQVIITEGVTGWEKALKRHQESFLSLIPHSKGCMEQCPVRATLQSFTRGSLTQMSGIVIHVN